MSVSNRKYIIKMTRTEVIKLIRSNNSYYDYNDIITKLKDHIKYHLNDILYLSLNNDELNRIITMIDRSGEFSLEERLEAGKKYRILMQGNALREKYGKNEGTT